MADSESQIRDVTHEPTKQNPSEMKTAGYFDDMFSGLREKRNKKNRALFTNLMHVIRRIVFIIVAMHFHNHYWV